MIFICPPREEIQASPETLTKKSAKSTKSFRAACHLRGGLPHVCGFGGAVADTLFLLMGHMSQRLDGALFLTLENYSLMYFKGILMRTLEAQRTQLCRFSFQVPEVWCYLMSLANLLLFLPCLCVVGMVLKDLIVLTFLFPSLPLMCSSRPAFPQQLLSEFFTCEVWQKQPSFLTCLLKTFSESLSILTLLT